MSATLRLPSSMSDDEQQRLDRLLNLEDPALRDRICVHLTFKDTQVSVWKSLLGPDYLLSKKDTDFPTESLQVDTRTIMHLLLGSSSEVRKDQAFHRHLLDYYVFFHLLGLKEHCLAFLHEVLSGEVDIPTAHLVRALYLGFRRFDPDKLRQDSEDLLLAQLTGMASGGIGESDLMSPPDEDALMSPPPSTAYDRFYSHVKRMGRNRSNRDWDDDEYQEYDDQEGLEEEFPQVERSDFGHQSAFNLQVLNLLSEGERKFEIMEDPKLRRVCEQLRVLCHIPDHSPQMVSLHTEFEGVGDEDDCSSFVAVLQRSLASVYSKCIAQKQTDEEEEVGELDEDEELVEVDDLGTVNVQLVTEDGNETEELVGAHIEILIWRTNFFHRMTSFSGLELNDYLRTGRIMVEILDHSALVGLVEWAYTSRIDGSASLGTLVQLWKQAKLWHEERMLPDVVELIRRKSTVLLRHRRFETSFLEAAHFLEVPLVAEARETWPFSWGRFTEEHLARLISESRLKVGSVLKLHSLSCKIEEWQDTIGLWLEEESESNIVEKGHLTAVMDWMEKVLAGITDAANLVSESITGGEPEDIHFDDEGMELDGDGLLMPPDSTDPDTDDLMAPPPSPPPLRPRHYTARVAPATSRSNLLRDIRRGVRLRPVVRRHPAPPPVLPHAGGGGMMAALMRAARRRRGAQTHYQEETPFRDAMRRRRRDMTQDQPMTPDPRNRRNFEDEW